MTSQPFEASEAQENGKVSELLAVPRYADLVEEDTKTSEEELNHVKTQTGLIKSREGWQKEMKKWVEEERDQSDDDGELANVTYETDIDEQLRRAWRRQAYTQEARMMELLADEEADPDRMPDDGELEGLGDDY
ncbi:hypothetical protein K443DRAFT_121822 [Laccaria amethystina LaAM-08-1]|uniref:Uncharacterized protein n=1 Tax=Laccaria amethystina LaAM-08-1 TaxID=1095629 RepID=A0A0C9Y3J4_9AGAR|nr:hypothetical protein K443DRAFT_121822 [Laccaria amethystina LaAM-08-1]